MAVSAPRAAPLVAVLARGIEGRMTMTPERLAELDAAVAHDTRGVMTLLYKNWPDLRAHIDAQAATIARLRGALEPFAKEAACWDEEHNDGFSFPNHEPLEMESQLQVKHLRDARAALSEDGQ